MAGNSQRRGAVRKPGTKKGATVGSGGQRGKKLEGRGPTPRAEDRPGHAASRRTAGRGAGAGGSSAGPGGGRGSGAGGHTPRSQPPSSQSRGSRGSASEWVAGRNSVLEALQSAIPATSLHVQAHLDADERVRESMRLAIARGVALLETTRGELDRLSGGAVHQGVVLQVPPFAYADPQDLLDDAFAEEASPVIVVLDGVTDPRNLGSVVRCAGAFGAMGVVIPQRRAAGVTAAAWKASAGAAARVRVARATNLVRFLVAAQQAGATVIGLAADGDVDLPELDDDVAAGPLVIVVGSEGRGMGRLVRQTCDLAVAIPMDAGTESLNAGVAAGIVLYAVAAARR